jgi:hypothetical protein
VLHAELYYLSWLGGHRWLVTSLFLLVMRIYLYLPSHRREVPSDPPPTANSLLQNLILHTQNPGPQLSFLVHIMVSGGLCN